MRKIFLWLGVLIIMNAAAFASIKDGLVSYWSFDEGPNDDFGTNNGTLQGSPIHISCKIKNCYNFTGSNYISLTENILLKNNDFAIAGWVKPHKGYLSPILSRYRDFVQQQSWQIHIGFDGVSTTGTKLTFLYTPTCAATDEIFINGNDMTLNEWHHFAVIRDGNILYIFVDNQKTTHSITTSIGDCDNLPAIGHMKNYIYYFLGQIDELAYWNRSLNASEVAILWNNGTGRPVIPEDKDNDNYTVDIDCNDNNPTIYPNATELCDGFDNQCPGDDGYGEIDEGFNDTDNDTIKDCVDNCIDFFNPYQENSDIDDLGDACDNCVFIYNDDQNNSDNDTLGDACDNCPFVTNQNQADMDNDSIGDVCDDGDNDTIYDSYDNCPDDYNPTQIDSDNDSIGNACDNCWKIYNPGQENDDNDSMGDICDDCTDPDGDELEDKQRFGGECPHDNCPYIYNPTQEETDGDGIGNICDLCADDPENDIDDDLICIGNDFKPPKLGGNDNCPTIPNTNQADNDTDSIGDVCDGCTDTDGDGFGNPGFPANICPIDNCPDIYNPNQNDIDGDGIGDVCDNCTDPDNDTICDPEDNCHNISNSDQSDVDVDTVGDVCDNCINDYNPGQENRDDDDLGNACDNCPGITNADQEDTDKDGIGDACTEPLYPVTISLAQGWNLVASPFHQTMNSTEALKSIEGCYEGIYSFDLGIWSMLVPENPFNSIDIITPNQGYWIKVNCSNVDWTI